MSQGLCPSCGAAVNLTAGQTETKCQYCQNPVTLQQAEAQSIEAKNSKASGSLLLAQMASANGDYQKALTFYEKAIEQDEKSSEAWLGRGVCLARIDQDTEINRERGFSRPPRIKADEAISCLETAILFAAKPDAMAKRATKAVAEAVAKGLEFEYRSATLNYGNLKEVNWAAVSEESIIRLRRGERALDFNIMYCEFDYEKLLTWGLTKDRQGEFLLKTGADFYSRATPWIEHLVKCERLDATTATKFRQNREEYLKALEPINPEARSNYDVIFFKFQSAYKGAIKPQHGATPEKTVDQELGLGLPPSVVELIKKEGSNKIAAIKELRERRPGLDLAEAKTIVEEAGSKLGTMTPTKGGSTESAGQNPAPPILRRSSAKRVPIALCAIFLGWLGIHKFMLGYIKEGIIQLVLGVFCLVGILIGVSEGIIYLTKSDEEFAKTYIQGQRKWF